MLRLIEMLIPEKKKTDAEVILKEQDNVLDFWYDNVSEKQVLVKILIPAEKSQNVLDELEDKFGSYEQFRMLLFPVNASIPRVEEEKEEEEEKSKKEKEEKKENQFTISREELYSNIVDKSSWNRVYILLIMLSSIVAAIGVMRGDIAVIIGAMVIAPLLGPNVGLSLATTLADSDLGKKALKTNAFGILLSFMVALVIGIFLTVDPNEPILLSRTTVRLGDIALALAAGSAGSIAFTRGLSEYLIGVMVALALVPTLVAGGLLVGAGYFNLAAGALLLFLVNLICINLAGVVTFLVQGIKPRSWWEADKAKRLSRLSLVIWITLLLILISVLFYLESL